MDQTTLRKDLCSYHLESGENQRRLQELAEIARSFAECPQVTLAQLRESKYLLLRASARMIRLIHFILICRHGIDRCGVRCGRASERIVGGPARY